MHTYIQSKTSFMKLYLYVYSNVFYSLRKNKKTQPALLIHRIDFMIHYFAVILSLENTALDT